MTERARRANRSFREQADLESERLPEPSARERLRRIRESMGRFYFSEHDFLERFFARQQDRDRFAVSGSTLVRLNALSWYLLLTLGFLAFCLPAYPRNDYLLPLSLKGMAFLLTTQPLAVPVMHGRYYVALIPVCALLVALTLGTSPRAAWSEWRGRSAHDWLLAAGQACALLYGVANVVVFALG